MIPTSVQPATDATAPFLSYAGYALLFVAGFLVFGWICVGGPQRMIRRHIAARHVLNHARAFCREADRQAQR